MWRTRLFGVVLAIFILTFVTAFLPSSSYAVSISGLYNTGVDNNGKLLADGVVDQHYTLIQNPNNSGPNAQVVNSTGWQFVVWKPNGPTSKWISPNADTSSGSGGGDYIYRMTFDLSGLDASTAILSSILGSDDEMLNYSF